MAFRTTGLTAGLFISTLLIAPSFGCESDEFSGAPRAEAPDEPMVDRREPRRKKRPGGRRSGQTSLPSDHPPVGGAQGEQDRGGSPPQAPSGGGGGADLPVQWEVPGAWTETEPSSRMRAAQFRLSGADGAGPATLAVYHFARKGGGSVRANIDRWVGQFEKPEGGSAKDSAQITEKTVNGLKVHLVDVAGTYKPGAGMGAGKAKENHRMLGAIVKSSAGLVFFKLIGPKSTISDHREEFTRFVESFRPAS